MEAGFTGLCADPIEGDSQNCYHTMDCYIKWIGVESGYETGRGIGTPAVETLVKFVEKNELADLIKAIDLLNIGYLRAVF
jgi:ribosomal protein S18 acetylase RimI-like enzyme